MEEAILEPEVQPASLALTCISSLTDLQADTIYCDSQEVLDHINRMDSPLLKDTAKKVVPHTLSLELLHYYGPYETDCLTNYVYVAHFENDSSRAVLVSLEGDEVEMTQMDYYLNKTFKIKNFLAINTKDFFFNCGEFNSILRLIFNLFTFLGDIECEIAEKPLHDIAIVTRGFLNSTLEFDESFRELTKLSEVVYPSNKAQAFNFVNVIGFVEVVLRSNKIDSFIISEENTKNFLIKLGYCQLDQLKQNPQQMNIETVFFSPSDRSVVYPNLVKRDLVCIHDLCLGTGPINIVVHPDQLFVSFCFDNFLKP